MDRRRFLAAVGTAGIAGLGIASCGGSKFSAVSSSGQSLGWKRLPMAKLSADRVIKETVGLRPFRLSGPRLDAQKMGSKTIVHNYGHGGSGFSLSWGCADIIAEQVAATLARGEEVAVIGCGIIGLTTARTLQDRGYRVVMYAKELFPNHTSSKATGTWSPAHLLCEEERITPAFKTQWERACRYSFRAYQNLLGLGDVVEWMDQYSIGRGGGSGSGRGARGTELQVAGLMPDRVALTPAQHPFRSKEVSIQPSMVFNIPGYLQKLLDDFALFGGRVVVREFADLDEVAGLSQACMVNCTGLGAKKLCEDNELDPISGQLAFLIPQPELHYKLNAPGGYFIPRKDGLVVGGNSIRGSWDTEPKEDVTRAMIAALNEVVQAMKS